jgi:apolipoprotein N-acyltransferase
MIHRRERKGRREKTRDFDFNGFQHCFLSAVSAFSAVNPLPPEGFPMPRVFVPAVLSGLLLWTAYFPLNLGPVGFFALVPWLTLVRADVSRRRRYFAAYLGGVTFFVLATNWVRVAHPMMIMSWIGLSIVMPVTWMLALAFIRRLDRLGLPLALSVPIGWVALEYARMHFPTGFAFLKPLGIYQMIGFGWYFLGYTQHAFLPFIQMADLGGVYLVSFVVGAVNGTIADWVLRSEVVSGWLKMAADPSPNPLPQGERGLQTHPSLVGKGVGGLGFATVAVLALVGASVGYGFVRLAHPDFAPGPRVAALQGSVPQMAKMDDSEGLFDLYNRLCLSVVRDADLTIWPETCYPFDLYTVAPGIEPKTVPASTARAVTLSRDYLRFFSIGIIPPGLIVKPEDVPPPWRANVLLGTNTYEWDGTREVPANTALLIGPDGSILGRYDKMHLVPFGEYVPLRTICPWMQTFTPYKHDYSCRPGESWTRFPLKARDGRDFTFGCLICYEDSDPYLARHYVESEPVNFLVNTSNDGWFDGTEEHEEHLAICRFRAIEARRSIVRSVNMGISGLIDPDGRVLATIPKKTEGVVTVTVPIDTRGSLYALLGDWVPATCWALVLVGIVILRMRRRA